MAAAGQGPRIIVGVDYGTTYTALAYMNIGNSRATPSIADLVVVRDWPRKNSPKVPSTISYSECACASRCRQWGHDMCNEDNSTVMQWTKLELPRRTTLKELEVLRDLAQSLDLVTDLHTKDSAAVPRHLARDPEDVVRDYLYKISRKWYQDMKSRGQFTLTTVPVDMVITHPANWPYEAMNKTFRAVTGAFPREVFPTVRDIYLSSEPEACALNTMQEIQGQDRHLLIPGECFVLCDAGGGTVDVASYRIDQLNPLKVTSVGGVSGMPCGATRVDQGFLEWLQPRLVDPIAKKDVRHPGPLELTPLGRRLLDRFQDMKLTFDGRKGNVINLPRGIKVTPGATGIENGVISLTADDLKACFEGSVAGTEKLIKQQVTKVQHLQTGQRAAHVTNVFLAGGFAENQYLYNAIKSRYTDRNDISLFRATDCWSGVAKGAVLRVAGLGMKVDVKGTACPRHYGICIARKRDKSLDRITWLVRQGDLIPSDKGIEATLVGQCKISSLDLFHARLARVAFVATDMPNPPNSLAKIKKNQDEIKYMNVDDIPAEAGPNRSLDVQIRIMQGVEVRVLCKGYTLAVYDTTL